MKASLVVIFTFFALVAQAKIIDVQGHRGARGNRPENTIPAFDFALEAGADTLEMDLGITRDDQIVLNHDRTINPKRCQWDDGRPLEKPILIHRLTLAEIKKLDCGSLRNPDFPHQILIPHTPIPTLDEIFERYKDAKSKSGNLVKFNIETKISFWHPYDTVPPRRFSDLVLAKVYQHEMLNRVVLESFDYRTLKAAKKITPCIKISALTQNPFENLAHTAHDLKAEYVSPRWNLLSLQDVEEVHREGAKVLPWIPNTMAQWEHLVKMGVDAIISDYPQDLFNYLHQNEYVSY